LLSPPKGKKGEGNKALGKEEGGGSQGDGLKLKQRKKVRGSPNLIWGRQVGAKMDKKTLMSKTCFG